TIKGGGHSGEAVLFDTNSQTVSLTGAVAITNLEITTLTDTNATPAGTLSAASFSQSGGSNTTVTLKQALTASGVAGISLNANTITVNGGLTVTSGPVSLTASGTDTVSTNAVSLGSETLTVDGAGATTISSA